MPPPLPTLAAYQPRGPWGITPNISSFLHPDYGQIARLGQRTPMEASSLQSVSDLARLISGQGGGLYNIGSPAYTQALAYYQRLLGGDKAAMTEAVAPEAQALSEVYKGAGNSLEAGPLRGGARETATAELGRQKTGQIAGLIPQARQAAAGAAGQLGLAGATAGTSAETAGASLYNQVVGNEQANRQTAISQSLAQQNLGAQTTLGAARLTLDDLVQSGQLGLQEYQALTAGQLGLGRLTLDQYLGQGNLSLRQQELAQRIKEYQNQQSQQQGSMWGKILGGLLGLFGNMNNNSGKGGGSRGPTTGSDNFNTQDTYDDYGYDNNYGYGDYYGDSGNY